VTPLERAALAGVRAAALAALRAAAARASAPAAAELLTSADMLALLDAWVAPTREAGRRVGAELPVCRHWPSARAEAARGHAGPIGLALATLGPRLHWAQNPNYRRQPPHPIDQPIAPAADGIGRPAERDRMKPGDLVVLENDELHGGRANLNQGASIRKCRAQVGGGPIGLCGINGRGVWGSRTRQSSGLISSGFA